MSPYGAAHKRNEFETWATAQGMSVGRDEGGYYDDDDAGKKAWKCWCAAIDSTAEKEAFRHRRNWLGQMILQRRVKVWWGDMSGHAGYDEKWVDE
jgi:hypothetical protein